MAGYLALGLVGAPVFHNGLGGPAVLAGPTGGYLVGFLPLRFLMGLVAGRVRAQAAGGAGSGETWPLLVAGRCWPSAAIYAVGVPWLAVFTGGSLGPAVTVGAVPFLLGDLLKTAVAVGPSVRARACSRRGLLPF